MMHDLDRTLDAAEADMDFLDAGEFEGDFGEEFEDDFGEEFEDDFGEEFEDDDEIYADGETAGVFDDAEEMELAAELLTVGDDEELEQFLGKLIRRAGKRIRRFAKSSTGRALGRVLKGAARKALPIAGRAAGTFLGGPVGGALGGRLASLAGRKFFGLELEGLSPEDQEFEVARRFVRFAGEAAKNAAMAPKSAPAATTAKAAAKAAARKHAPGLTRGSSSMGSPSRGRRSSGRWIRRGRRIIVLGA